METCSFNKFIDDKTGVLNEGKLNIFGVTTMIAPRLIIRFSGAGYILKKPDRAVFFCSDDFRCDTTLAHLYYP